MFIWYLALKIIYVAYKIRIWKYQIGLAKLNHTRIINIRLTFFTQFPATMHAEKILIQQTAKSAAYVVNTIATTAARR